MINIIVFYGRPYKTGFFENGHVEKQLPVIAKAKANTTRALAIKEK
jgi:hypothetical protein